MNINPTIQDTTTHLMRSNDSTIHPIYDFRVLNKDIQTSTSFQSLSSNYRTGLYK